jgi:predicted alpha/beta-hydrolase family hydrolase
MKPQPTKEAINREVRISVGDRILEGEISVPKTAPGIVLFAHGSGSSRHSPSNQFVAKLISEAGVGTLLFDLLTREEEAVDLVTRHLRFDIDLLPRRLIEARNWLTQQDDLRDLRVGYFGSSTGGGAAPVASAELGERVGAVVSRGGRPDLAGTALRRVVSPTLLIVGELDEVVIRLNLLAFEQLQCRKDLKIIPGATHLFEEPGTLEEVARLAAQSFQEHLSST